jgi:hypothetical protein
MIINSTALKKYFRPKSWEYIGRSSVYRYLGIRWFKKYLPTSGDWVRRNASERLIKPSGGSPDVALRDYELTTRVHEFRHWLGMLAFIALAFVFDYTVMDYVVVTVLFLVINVYPILLQRHNRVRIMNALNKHGKPTPYDD